MVSQEDTDQLETPIEQNKPDIQTAFGNESIHPAIKQDGIMKKRLLIKSEANEFTPKKVLGIVSIREE